MSLDAIVANFAETASEYCRWLESPPGEPKHEHFVATQLVARLIAGAVQLPGVKSDHLPRSLDAPEVDEALENKIRERLKSFPLQYYYEVFHCLGSEPEAPSCGDITDDLGDIYSDVKAGLLAHEQGQVALAVWHWRFTFGVHWGRHATSGLRALYEFEPPDAPGP